MKIRFAIALLAIAMLCASAVAQEKTADYWIKIGDDLALNKSNNQEALTAYEKAIQLDPRNFQAWEEVVLVYHVLGKYNESLTAYEKLTEIKPENALVWKGKGDALKALGRQSEADAAFAKAKELGYKN
ncbi:MAG: tetratricopeptide repeat protein [Methanothrix sp.]|nr:tetratricopeptide repeat protein [Methanothrix sp.]